MLTNLLRITFVAALITGTASLQFQATATPSVTQSDRHPCPGDDDKRHPCPSPEPEQQ